MSVLAHMRDGQAFRLADACGETPPDVLAHALGNSLTGSAEPLANVWLPTADGHAIRYSEIVRMETAT